MEMNNRTNYGIISDNPKFCDIWPNEKEWFDYIKENPIKLSLDDDNLRTLYYLLYSRYGNSTIASSDRNRFQMNVVSIIFSYGPTWSARLKLQNKIRELSDEQLMAGSKIIVNHAYNPSDDPSTGALEELSFINEQNTSSNKKSKAEAYALLESLLRTDVTEQFLSKFKNLFIKILAPIRPVLFEVDEEEY